jgi:homoserine O-acetyltransferase
MKITKYYLLIISLLTINIIAQSEQEFARLGDFKLINDDVISDCIIGYRTFGKLNEDTSNVIIYCSWFAGTSESIGSLLEKRNFVDTSKYFIIAFDALGNGVSSSPSNYADSSFPAITIRDMVNSQYLVLTKHFGINHLYGAIGGSMGSMQVLEWAVAYPDFIENIVAYVSSPKLSSYDLLWMQTQLRMIDILRKNNASEKEIKTLSDMMTAWISRTPDYINENVKSEEFDKYFLEFENEPSKTFTNDNYIAQMKAMIGHDISKNFNGSMEEVANIIKSDLFLIVSRSDLMVNPIESIRLAELTEAKIMILDNNCGHLGVSCEFDLVKEAINNFFSR